MTSGFHGVIARKVLPSLPGLEARSLYARASAATALAFGIPSFFTPRMPPPFLHPAGSPAALSFYDTAPLADTPEEPDDVDRPEGRRGGKGRRSGGSA